MASSPETSGAHATDVLADLDARGLVHDLTDREDLAACLRSGPVTLYCGFDPTADSLHLGNLQALLMLRRFQDAGHRPIVLAGGATGLIGDPGGRDSERPILTPEQISVNLDAVMPQLRRFVDFDAGERSAVLVDNRTWTAPMGVLDFLREVGKHVTVNTMLRKESVRSRLDRDSGISFTEFSYMLLQANDFAVLHREFGCRLQVAGSDQWGNITAGIDLIRRTTGESVHGLTAPLITSADGRKFGKSTGGGGLWLDAAKTSPYQLYQHLLHTDDRDVRARLLRLTLLPVDEIDAAANAHERAPERRTGQRLLARTVTAFLHGEEAARTAQEVSGVLFGSERGRASDESGSAEAAVAAATFEAIEGEVPTTRLARSELSDLDTAGLFARTGLARSKGEFRRNIDGFSCQGQPASSVGRPADALMHDRWILLRKGRQVYHLVVVV